jgi:hypothetical protein
LRKKHMREFIVDRAREKERKKMKEVKRIEK